MLSNRTCIANLVVKHLLLRFRRKDGKLHAIEIVFRFEYLALPAASRILRGSISKQGRCKAGLNTGDVDCRCYGNPNRSQQWVPQIARPAGRCDVIEKKSRILFHERWTISVNTFDSRLYVQIVVVFVIIPSICCQ